jgi:uncharacterized protein YkwD
MRSILSLATILVFVAHSPADELPKAKAEMPTIRGAQPSVVLAQATSKDDKITLNVKTPALVYKQLAETITVEEPRKVDGKEVKVPVMKTVTKTVCFGVFKEHKVQLGELGVWVSDLAGKAVSSEEVLKRLEKETAILSSMGGPADSFYLQTNKPDTLILITPTPPAPVVPMPAAPVVPTPATGKVTPPVPSTTPPTKPKGDLEPKALPQQVIDLANAERKKAGASTVSVSDVLLKAAQQHSANMAKQEKLSHSIDGKGLAKRLTEIGYPYKSCGENVARGQQTPADVIQAWMNSPGHRENLLNPDHSEIGVAFSTGADGRLYWTMILARSR